MKTRVLVGTIAATGLALGVGQMNAIALPAGGGEGLPTSGPDVIVGDIPDVARYTPGTFNGIQYASYAIGSTSCNIGTTQLQWQPNPSNKHPTIPQNFYRVKNGAIEQIGLSWCKHGFCALQENICGTCTPAGSGCPTVLGVGCSDPYTASLNGAQNDLKSRGPVNPATGHFSGTYTDPAAPTGIPSSIRERLAIARNDLDAAQNAGAVYFGECQYIHIDDAAANNDDNNASYRRFTVGSTWSSTQGYSLTPTGTTQRGLPAIYAWQSVHSDVSVKAVDVAGDGRFFVAYRAIDNGNGTWRYEYAVQNLNSDRAGGSFSVPVPAGVTVSNVGFKSPAYINGEGYTNAAWTVTQANGMLTWTCEPNTNANANALRWSTLYSFRFVADAPPVAGDVTLGLWKAASAGSPATAATVAAAGPGIPAPPCSSADSNCDGVVNGVDLGVLLSQWGTSGSMDLNGDNIVDGADMGLLLAGWGTAG
ncbi:MAG: hypothetical protein FJ306_11855, partial [Planctomycetes bacterium]|nr:hypothetical protein [Planctomycetota bacterium]